MRNILNSTENQFFVAGLAIQKIRRDSNFVFGNTDPKIDTTLNKILRIIEAACFFESILFDFDLSFPPRGATLVIAGLGECVFSFYPKEFHPEFQEFVNKHLELHAGAFFVCRTVVQLLKSP